jgi:hypothetical protein
MDMFVLLNQVYLARWEAIKVVEGLVGTIPICVYSR